MGLLCRRLCLRRPLLPRCLRPACALQQIQLLNDCRWAALVVFIRCSWPLHPSWKGEDVGVCELVR